MKKAKQPSVTVRKATKTALSHIQSRKNSKLSVEQYCNLHKIGKSTFYNWVKRYGNLAAEIAFVPLILNPPNEPVASTPHKSFGIKIDMPQGMVLHIAAASKEGGLHSRAKKSVRQPPASLSALLIHPSM